MGIFYLWCVNCWNELNQPHTDFWNCYNGVDE